MKKRNSPEDDVQKAICRYLDAQGIFYHSVPNESAGRSKAEQIRLMQIGLRPGVADLVIWLGNGRVAYMECKSDIGRQSLSQKAFEAICAMEGFPYRVVRSLDEAKAFLKEAGL